MSEPPILEPGDVFLTRGRGFFAAAIRFFTRTIGESRTKVNHVGLVVESGPLRDAVIVESVSKVRRRRLGQRPAWANDRVAVYRPVGLGEDEVRRVVEVAESFVGRGYSYWKVVLHVLDWLLLGAYVFRRLGRMDDYPICSWLVAHAYSKVGRDFGVEPGGASPDDICDFVRANNPQLFVAVRGLEPMPPEPPRSAESSRPLAGARS